MSAVAAPPPVLASSRGRVRSLHRKPEKAGEHGLPKPSVPELWVSPSGVRDDFNRYRHEDLYDAPDQALLLMPVETIRALNAEGWPIHEGDIGENVTIEGLSYDGFHPGQRYRVGQAIVEVSKPCTPCSNLYLLPYVGREKGPGFVKTMIDRRGWFAKVVQEGRIQPGDVVERI